jgi:hypothetical protein
VGSNTELDQVDVAAAELDQVDDVAHELDQVDDDQGERRMPFPLLRSRHLKKRVVLRTIQPIA